jgi:hypothetical protein
VYLAQLLSTQAPLDCISKVAGSVEPLRDVVLYALGSIDLI